MYKPNKVIDCHLHLDDRIPGPAFNAAAELSRQLKDSKIRKGIVLHLQTQRWKVEEVAEAISEFDNLEGFVNIHPAQKNSISELERALRLGFIGLKLHPRLQNYKLNHIGLKPLIDAAGELNVPVLIDAFPDGDWLMMGFDPLEFIKIAKQSPKTKIIFGHFGGHKCIDFMMLAKRIPNIYFDFSYSLLYFRNSSVVGDILYCCKSMRYERIFYGTDYPDRSIDLSLKSTLDEFERYSITDQDQDKLLYENANLFYQW